MPVAQPAASSEWRTKGNSLYKSGDLLGAINAYTQSCKLAPPDDPTPLSNLSAAYFEAGDYANSLEMALQAISTIEKYESENKDFGKYETIKKRCYSRLLRSYLYLGDLKGLKELLDRKDLGWEGKDVQLEDLLGEEEVGKIKRAAGKEEEWTEEGRKERWKLIVERLPRYRPQLKSALEYFNLGHDSAAPLYDSELAAIEDETVSLMFAGIGDARNLLATLANIHSEEQKRGTNKKFYFTINDIKAPTLCRDFLLFLILDRIASNIKIDKQEPGDLCIDVLEDMTLIMYLFAAPLMPKYIWEQLQAVIKAAIGAFTGGQLPRWLHCEQKDVHFLLPALQSWLEPNGEALKLYTTSEAMKLARKGTPTRMGTRSKDIEKEAPPGCQIEFASFCEVGLVFPPKEIMAKHGDELEGMLPLMKKEHNTPDRNKVLWENARKYVERSWKANFTFLDVEWEQTGDHGEWDLAFNPFDCATHLFEKSKLRKPSNPKGLFDYIVAFFLPVAKAVKFLNSSGRLTVYTIYGDQSHVMDLCKHKLFDISDAGKGKPEILFDRIHMSNIPDYVGGTFTTFLYALPILKRHHQAFLTLVCLRNPNLFPGGAYAFNAEYTHIPSAQDLKKTLQGVLHPDTKKHEDELSNMVGIPLTNYFSWGPTLGIPLPLKFSQLLDKKKLTTWLYSVFFKLCLPANRDPALILRFVNNPLNLTMFFRLLIHLSGVGYPKHWLSQILSEILSNNVKTSARLPANSPITKSELDSWNNNPVVKISTKPFVNEVATLAAIFLPVLTFPIHLTPENAIVPTVDKINEYAYTPKQPLPITHDAVPVFVLLFFNKPALDNVMVDPSTAPSPSDMQMRLFFFGGENNSRMFKKGMLDKFRDSGGIVMVTTWEWDGKKRKGKFLMRDGVMERMMNGGYGEWWGGVWRTDSWKCQGVVETVKVTVEKVRSGAWKQ